MEIGKVHDTKASSCSGSADNLIWAAVKLEDAPSRFVSLWLSSAPV
jgi:hypothetical protein